MSSSTHRVDVQVRFGDTDALGHVNNVSFASYLEIARLEFLRALGKEVTSLILANLAIDFRKQVDFNDRVAVETWVEKLGRTSITLRQIVLANDERAADAGSVVVHFDYASNKPMELTPEIRAALQPYLRAP